jgi:hypothetical protein
MTKLKLHSLMFFYIKLKVKFEKRHKRKLKFTVKMPKHVSGWDTGVCVELGPVLAPRQSA